VTAPSRLEIVVDELVVRGLDPGEARVTVAAFEARLIELGTELGATIAARAEAFRRLPAVEAPAGSPRAVGAAVAGAVWGELGGGTRR